MPFKILLIAGTLAWFGFITEPFRTIQGQAQGSTYRIVYEDLAGNDFSKSIDSLFLIIDKSMSLWDANSLISNINGNNTNGPVDVHFENVFRSSELISRTTNGYFDVTVGPLVKAWGFGTKKGLSLPNQTAVDSLRKLVNYKNVSLKAGRISKKYQEIQLDFNAMAQGYTVDVVADFLIKKGIHNFLVEIGGEVRAKGKNSKGEVWKVGVENPADENNLKAIVALNDKSLATSGSYRKFFLKDGKKFSHAIDPHLGKPVSHNLLSITVLTNNCASADAYATAFLVMGFEKSKVIAQRQKIEFLAIYEENNRLQTFATEGFKKAILE